MKKFLMALLFVSLTASVVCAEEVVDKTLAIVNGEPLMSSEFDKLVGPFIEQQKAMLPISEQTDLKINELKDKLLEERISQMLLMQEAKKHKIKIPKRELDAAINQIKSRFPNESAFKEELAKEGITQAQFEKRIEEQLMGMKFIEGAIKNEAKRPTETQIKAFYDNIQKRIKGQEVSVPQEELTALDTVAKFFKRMSSEQIKLRQIFVKCPKNATANEKKAAAGRVAVIKKELAKGTMSFADLSEKYSEDQLLRQRKGDMGSVVKGDLTPELSNVAFSLIVGQYTKEPVKTDFGYHFLRVEEMKAAQSFSYDDVKNELAEVLYQNSAKEAYDKLVKGIKSKANITINKVW